MKKRTCLSLLAYSLIPMALHASELTDTLTSQRNYALDEVVVTGTRNATDIRPNWKTVTSLPCFRH